MNLSEDVDIKRVEKKIGEWWAIHKFIYNRPIRSVQSVPMTRRRYIRTTNNLQTYNRCSNRCYSVVYVCRTKSPK